jgi:hypothetical protein
MHGQQNIKFQTKFVEKLKTNILCSRCFVFPKIVLFMRLRFACWVTKATNTHREYLTLSALPLQQWLPESASVLRQAYIAPPVLFSKHSFSTTRINQL